MSVKYLEEPCTCCGKTTVRPPLVREMKKRLILVPCDSCGKHSRYNITDHADGTQGYYLSHHGAKGQGLVQKTWRVFPHQAEIDSETARARLGKD